MDSTTSLKWNRYDLFKLVIATVVFFLLFVRGEKKAGEPKTMIQVDYLAQEDEIPEHESALPVLPRTERLCEENQQMCQKIVRSGAFTEEEKFLYTSQYLKIFSFLDEKLMRGNDILDAFQTLIINSEKGKRRGGATWKRITINLSSMGDPSEFWGVLTHEFGHIVDLGVLQGVSNYKNTEYTEFGKVKFERDDPSLEYYAYSRVNEKIRASGALKKDFCSGYGMSNPFEDFAECHNLYLNNKLLFQQMAKESSTMKNKYNYFANLFDNHELKLGNHPLLYQERRPRDTTLI